MQSKCVHESYYIFLWACGNSCTIVLEKESCVETTKLLRMLPLKSQTYLLCVFVMAMASSLMWHFWKPDWINLVVSLCALSPLLKPVSFFDSITECCPTRWENFWVRWVTEESGRANKKTMIAKCSWGSVAASKLWLRCQFIKYTMLFAVSWAVPLLKQYKTAQNSQNLDHVNNDRINVSVQTKVKLNKRIRLCILGSSCVKLSLHFYTWNSLDLS